MSDTTRPATRNASAPSSDGPSPDARVGGIGRRRFLAGAGAATAGVLAPVWTAGTASAAPAGASRFVPLTQSTRVLDTREPQTYPFTVLGPSSLRVAITGAHGITPDATAIVATLTAVNGNEPNWVTIVPAGTSIDALLAQNRLVSVLNLSWFGQASANLAHVRLAGGGVDIAWRRPCDVVLDVIGYYRPVTGPAQAGRYVGLQAARRALDTRETVGEVPAGSSLDVDLTAFIPGDASAAVINLTATECAGPGFFTAYPATSATVPTASSLNVNAFGETRAAAVVVPLSTVAGRRAIKVFAHTAAKLIVDVTGYYTGPTSPSSDVGLFVPVDPVRILDTRDPGQIGNLWPGWVVEGAIPGAGATGGGSAVVNLTGVDTRGPGFLTIAAARRALPPTSNVNFTGPGQVVPNHAVTPITAGQGYQVFASGGSHVIVDYMGYFTGTPAAATTSGPPVNPPPPPIAPEWILEIPRIGVRSRVLTGNADAVVNRGHSWHWEGTGFLGQEAHVGAFAHRTTHGGVYRNLHLLSGGDEFTLTTMDGRMYTYVVVRRDLTDGRVQNILAATRLHPGTTFSLIACTKPDFTPTSTRWRIVLTGALVGWRQV